MENLSTIILATLLAGMAMPAGAIIARIEKIHPNWLEQEFRHSVIAFGGGALLSAVALVLVPEGTAAVSAPLAVSLLLLGGIGFALLDFWLNRNNTPASQLAAMLSDFLPESIALGAAFASDENAAFLLAAIIALQNLPEGFNAFRELKEKAAFSTQKIILGFSAMALLGPLAGLIGYFWLAQSTAIVGGIMLLAAGGILYSVFQDIAPQAKLEKHWAPPMGAVLGFVLGVLGDYLA